MTRGGQRRGWRTSRTLPNTLNFFSRWHGVVDSMHFSIRECSAPYLEVFAGCFSLPIGREIQQIYRQKDVRFAGTGGYPLHLICFFFGKGDFERSVVVGNRVKLVMVLALDFCSKLSRWYSATHHSDALINFVEVDMEEFVSSLVLVQHIYI